MENISEDAVKTALATIPDPMGEGDIVATQRVAGVVVKAGNVHIMLDIDGLATDKAAALREICEAKVRAIKGVLSASCVMTAHQNTTKDKPAPNREIPPIFQQIKHVIAIASGKGGVGKSTIAVNLAIALQQAGHRVGLLDADIYGPSAPQLLGITTRPDVDDDKKLIPITRYGLHTMSIGYMVPPEQAMIWRGPMVQSALLQMLNDVAWQPLDVLVMDMPPGTGDIQLTMAQRIPVSGAVIVSTPAQLALADVRRAIAMFRRVEIPILGLVNNMAYMDVGDERLYPFGEARGATTANDSDIDGQIDGKIDWLGDIPLDPALQQASEHGTPPLIDAQDSPIAQKFTQIAASVMEKLKI